MLNDIFCPGRIKLNLEGTTKTEVFEELIETIAVSNSEFERRGMLEAVLLRESKMNTIIRPGIAVPHGYSPCVRGIIGTIGFSRIGIEYDKLDPNPVHLFFMLLLDESSWEEHLEVLSRLLKFLNSAAFPRILGNEMPQDIYEQLCCF